MTILIIKAKINAMQRGSEYDLESPSTLSGHHAREKFPTDAVKIYCYSEEGCERC